MTRRAIRGRSVVVTGGAGGLGQEIVAELARRGAAVLAVDIHARRLEQLRLCTGCEVLTADVADPAGLVAVTDAAGAGGRPAHTLIHCAGVEKASRFADLDAAEVRRALEVNLLGAMALTHALLPGMVRAGTGQVVCIASMAALKPVPYNAVYNTAKSGLVAFSLSLSKELRGTGVDATVICPTAVTGAGMWARASHRLPRNPLVETSAVPPAAVVAAVVRAMTERPRRILVGSPLVRWGALLSALSPAVDAATDRLSRIEAVYRRRIGTDRDNRL